MQRFLGENKMPKLTDTAGKLEKKKSAQASLH
jgi:hypothetical protein